MKVFKFIFFALVLAFSSCSQTELIIEELPANTPKGTQLFAAGNFNNWNPGDARYMFKYDKDANVYRLFLPSGFGKLTYKITRGDWYTVETGRCGDEILNRSSDANDAPQVKLTILGWHDLEPINCNRITFIIDSLPVNTPLTEKVYLSTNTEGWMAAKENYDFKRLDNGKLILTVNKSNAEELLFKVTRGSWSAAECDANGLEKQPQSVVFGTKDTIHLTVQGWLDLVQPKLKDKWIVITSLPPLTPSNSKIYLANSLNNWSPRDLNYMFKWSGGKWWCRLQLLPQNTAEFKLTRGSWETVETRFNFIELPNRKIGFNDKDTLYITVENWNDLSSKFNKHLLNIRPQAPSPPESKLMPTNVSMQKISTDQFKQGKRKIMIILEKLPTSTQGSPLYLTGDFNDWETRLSNFQFKPLPNGKWYFMLRLNDYFSHEFKITRGSWNTEEASANGDKLNNRIINQGLNDDTLRLRIENWLDAGGMKVVIAIKDFPDNTPKSDKLFLTGDFNGWNPNDETFVFKKHNGIYYLSIDDFGSKYNEYKITRGSWETEAAGRNGKYLMNQRFAKPINDTIFLKVDKWRDYN